MKHTRETWQLTEAALTLLSLGPVYSRGHVRAAREYLELQETDDGPEVKLKQAIVLFLKECEEIE